MSNSRQTSRGQLGIGQGHRWPIQKENGVSAGGSRRGWGTTRRGRNEETGAVYSGKCPLSSNEFVATVDSHAALPFLE